MSAKKRFPGAAAVVLGALSFTACSGAPAVINTDDTTSAQQAAPAPPTTSTRPSNAHLANAFHYAAQVNGTTGYYFTSPSGRWQCAILPRERAGCQNASGSAIAVTGAPDEVAGPDGEPATPNAILVDRADAPQFAALSSPGFGLESGEAVELPFNRVLAAAGFRCNVQESTGISCVSEFSGHGFTFSADGYTPHYTDVPADAP
ncbi:hypothetical protein Mycch_2814 [Mycolicibacterium chubuense NBB4]|uniref:Lipoprotein n=1 Tax=Mycolicibacterium chubuense (strain NBB4) TaxID=710421 RepID=I4BJW8_MYCCN|nr:hypothetical protein [Mycolicibacterium chubuense]AFM17575.1 hypothetical protein Mycch_2814 [Mycolicibacterium chubuense NBB4]